MPAAPIADYQAGRPQANDQKIINGLRLRIFPLRRMHLFEKFAGYIYISGGREMGLVIPQRSSFSRSFFLASRTSKTIMATVTIRIRIRGQGTCPFD